MAILGFNTDGGGIFSANAGRKVAGKFNLATTQKLTELHAWVGQGSSTSNSFIIHIHADSAGSPGARIAYTNPITPALGSDPIEISESGFSNILTAGDYWLGITYQGSSGNLKIASSGGTLKCILGGAAFNPPSDPFGAPDFNNSNKVGVWAVVVAPTSPPVADFTGTPTSGPAPLSVTFTDTTANTPTSWAWDFGDGTTSTSQNPSHSYASSGVYTVSLTATNASGSNTKTRTAYITVSEAIVYATGGGVSIW